ncbi:MAG: transposase [Gammaproteobacteria bacterium]|jgi:stearoyl-CoA desaturase (Delta-9 desaturase)|nr:transposase [Gammaproteobacteria bacterium]
MLQGLVSMPWWGYVLVALVFTHLTIAAVTIYLHRNQAHRAVDLHPVVSHFFRLWLWLSTGMNTREWTAVHRKHHAAVETMEDPHSPVAHGIKKVLTEGAELYRINAKRQDIIDQYGYGTPDDWLERHFYTGRDSLGIYIMMAVNILLFGPLGLTIWAVQMAWIPIFAAGVINGIGHYWGYRNFETADASTNIMPWGILIGGEELHNNHHAFGSSAKFSVKPWEFDLGWMYIRIMETFGLATVRKLAPARPAVDEAKSAIDFETLKAVAGNRLHVMADFGRMVVKRVHREELARAGADLKPALKPLRRLLLRAEERLNDAERDRLQSTLPLSQPLAVVYGFRQRLQDIYEQRAASKENLLNLLQDWCQQAETTGIQALQDFARTLRGYTLAPQAL